MSELRSPHYARISLDFIIVGASITGLACAYNMIRAGHRVRILEQDEGILGGHAGLKSPPNMTRLLLQWGLGKELARISTKCSRLSMRIGSTGECIGALMFHDEVMEELQADVRLMSHIDLRMLLHDLVIENGGHVEFCSKIIELDETNPSVTLADGSKVYGDVIVGADGAKGIVRSVVVDQEREVLNAGPFDCYSFLVPTSDIIMDEDLTNLVNDNAWNMWMADGCALFTHLAHGSEELAVHFTYPQIDEKAQPGWTERVALSTFDFSIFDPRIQKLATFAYDSSAIRTKHIIRNPGQEWCTSDGKVVLLGEAAHIYNPASLQATAVCLEDAAVFGSLFSHIQSKDRIGHFCSVYQELRRARCEKIEKLELGKVQLVALPQGPEQAMRDESLRKACNVAVCDWENVSEEVLRQEWEQFQYAFGYDAYDEVDSWWVEWGSLEERAKDVTPEQSPIEGLSRQYEITEVVSGGDLHAGIELTV